jgi:ubiquitin-protein ligase
MNFWRMLLKGPEGGPYSAGVWLLYASFPDDYPRVAPQVRFITPIKHCNINSYGRICHSILDRNWTADTPFCTVLQCIYGLLLNPDVDDPLDSTLALQFFDDSGTYEVSVVEHTQRFATERSMEDWREVLLAEEGEDESGTGAGAGAGAGADVGAEGDENVGTGSTGSTGTSTSTTNDAGGFNFSGIDSGAFEFDLADFTMGSTRTADRSLPFSPDAPIEIEGPFVFGLQHDQDSGTLGEQALKSEETSM